MEIVTVGYTTATQSKDGLMHIVTTKNDPNNVEIELNEAWLLSDTPGPTPAATTTVPPTQHTELYPDGKPYATWSDSHTSDGRTVLEGPQTILYPNGKPLWTQTFHLGQPIGTEIYYRPDGTKVWQKIYAEDGTWTWLNFDLTNHQTAESRWKNKTLQSVTYTVTK